MFRPDRPRIGIFEASRGPSGPSRYVDTLLTALDPAEFEVIVFGHDEGPYRGRPNVRLASVTGMACCPTVVARQARSSQMIGRKRLVASWRRWAPKSLKVWAGFGRQCLGLASVFRRFRPDLLHTNNTGCEEAPVAAQLAGVQRVLGTFHVDSTYDLEQARSGIAHRTLEKVSNYCLDRAIAVSRATGRDWMSRTGIPAQRVLTVYNGINPQAFVRRHSRCDARAQLGLPADDRLVIGGIGRLDTAKGFNYLLEAFALLARCYPTATLALAGQGPLRDDLQQQAGLLGVADRVKFLGYCANISLVYEALDVFVLSSVCEALPYVVMEAMAAELPIVATRVGGVPEMIVAGDTGLLVPPRDPALMAAALRPMLDSVELRRRMGRAACQRVEQHFHERDMVRRTIQIYRDMLDLPRDHAPARA